MGLPGNVTVEVAFGTDPLADLPVWTDISAYVELSEQVTIRRGRASQTDQPQPGTLNLTVNNVDGRFTPGRSGSPYFPNVTINRRIRVSAVHSAVTYRLFDGHVDEWPLQYENGFRPLVQITATDRFKLMARRPMGGLYDEQSLSYRPTGYFPMAEDQGARAIRDSVPGGAPGLLRSSKYGSGVTAFSGRTSEPGNIPNINFSSPDHGKFGPVPLSYLQLDGTPNLYYDPAGFFAVSLWFTAGTVPPEWDSVLYENHHPDGRNIKIRILPSGQLNIELITDATPGAPQGTSFNVGAVLDNTWHHVVLSRGDGTLQGWLDGALVGNYSSPNTSFAALSGLSRLNLGATVRERTGDSGVSGGQYRGSLARLSLHNRALTTSEIAALYGIGVPFGSERSDLRAARLAALSKLPFTVAENQRGQSQISNEQTTDGQGADTALLEVAASEGGVVFIEATGRVVFQSRSLRINQPPAFTLTANDLEADLMFVLSDAMVVNDITVSRPGSGDARALSVTSVAAHGTYGEQAATLLTSTAETRHYGQWQLRRRATPQVRADTISIDPFTVPALYDRALGSELGTELTVTGLPTTAPAPSLKLVIEGITHTFNVNGWRTAWDTSQADDSDYLQWGLTWGSRVWAW